MVEKAVNDFSINSNSYPSKKTDTNFCRLLPKNCKYYVFCFAVVILTQTENTS